MTCSIQQKISILLSYFIQNLEDVRAKPDRHYSKQLNRRNETFSMYENKQGRG